MASKTVVEYPSQLEAKPGFKRIMCPLGPQAGRHVLRAAWINQAELDTFRRLGRRVRAIDADDEDPDVVKQRQQAELDLYTFVTQLVPEWDFLGRDGKPLAQPAHEPLVLAELDSLTIMWLYPTSQESLWGDILPNVS